VNLKDVYVELLLKHLHFWHVNQHASQASLFVKLLTFRLRVLSWMIIIPIISLTYAGDLKKLSPIKPVISSIVHCKNYLRML